MKIKILGAHNTESRNTHCVSLLIDDILALDAGGLTSTLSFKKQTRIKSLLLTHAHYDHIKDIPTLAMNMFLRRKTLKVYTHKSVQDKLMYYFLDGQIYPDFQNRPAANPTLRLHLLEAYEEVPIEEYRVLPIPVTHALPTLGYQITSKDGKSIFYTGDTGPELSEVWNRISPQVLFIELTAPNRWEDSMLRNGHMTPNLLKQELLNFKNIKGYLPKVFTVHMNPEGENEIKSEISQIESILGIFITIGYEGMSMEL